MSETIQVFEEIRETATAEATRCADLLRGWVEERARLERSTREIVSLLQSLNRLLESLGA